VGDSLSVGRGERTEQVGAGAGLECLESGGEKIGWRAGRRGRAAGNETLARSSGVHTDRPVSSGMFGGGAQPVARVCMEPWSSAVLPVALFSCRGRSFVLSRGGNRKGGVGLIVEGYWGTLLGEAG